MSQIDNNLSSPQLGEAKTEFPCGTPVPSLSLVSLSLSHSVTYTLHHHLCCFVILSSFCQRKKTFPPILLGSAVLCVFVDVQRSGAEWLTPSTEQQRLCATHSWRYATDWGGVLVFNDGLLGTLLLDSVREISRQVYENNPKRSETFFTLVHRPVFLNFSKSSWKES